MKIKKYANNQIVINTDKEIIFASYESIIAIIRNRKIIFGSDWDYSQTTLKYLYKFLNDYFVADEIDQAIQGKGKKEALQRLIDNKKIILNENL